MFQEEIDLSNVDQYDGKQVVAEDMPTKMR